jgi:hypothetical protein
MGKRGSGSTRRWLNPVSRDFQEMCFGPDPWDEKKFNRIRRHWRSGGREAVMRNWNVAGSRPFAFWLCEVSAADVRRAEAACRTEAECVLYLNLADDEERRRIAAEGVIEEELKIIAQDRKLHPEDYTFVHEEAA